MDRALSSFCSDTGLVIIVQGDLVSTNSDALAGQIFGCLAARTQERCTVTLDLRFARWIDAAGIRLVDTLGQRVKAECGSMLTLLISTPDLVRVTKIGMVSGLVRVALAAHKQHVSSRA